MWNPSFPLWWQQDIAWPWQIPLKQQTLLWQHPCQPCTSCSLCSHHIQALQVPGPSQTPNFPLAEFPIPTSPEADLQASNFGFWRLSTLTVCAMTWEPGALLFFTAAQRNGGKPALSHSSKCWSRSGVCPELPVPPPRLPCVTCTQGQGQAWLVTGAHELQHKAQPLWHSYATATHQLQTSNL